MDPGKFWYMQKIKDLLLKNEIPTFIAEPMPGKDILEITKARHTYDPVKVARIPGMKHFENNPKAKKNMDSMDFGFCFVLRFPLVSLFFRCSFVFQFLGFQIFV